MRTRLEGRLAKVEEIAKRGDVSNEVNCILERIGTTRAAMKQKHGTLWAFRDWLAAQPSGDFVL